MKSSYKDDELIINYNDACIYGRDLKLLLSNTEWLNDSCIHYWFQRLQEDKELLLLLLDPAVVSFFMNQCDDNDEMLDFANGYNQFNTYQYIIIPINDTLDAPYMIPGAGTHWSLLVIQLQKQQQSTNKINRHIIKSIHYDSISNSGNLSVAQAVHDKFQCMFLQLNNNNNKDKANTVINTIKVENAKNILPKQKNGYDCGLHVLLTAEMIVQKQSIDNIEEEIQQLFQKSNNNNYCIQLRNRIVNDIKILQKSKRKK